MVRALRAFGGLPTISIDDADLVAAALDLAGRGMDFADALHLGRCGHCDGCVTFDRKLIKAAATAGNTTVHDA